LGYSMGKQQNISESTAQTIDSEVRRLIEMGHSEARRIITEKRDGLEALAQGLLEYETLTGDEIMGLLDGKKPVRESDDESSSPPRSSPVPTTKRPPQAEGGLEPQPSA